MTGLRIDVLGPPRILVDGEPLVVDTRKATALLVYLAVTGQQHRRESLAALFWPDADESRARATLRRTLSTLSGALRGRWLVAGRDAILLDAGPDVALDLHRFRALASAPDDAPGLAADLWRGEFLAGFSLRDSPDFDDWQLQQAESLRREMSALLDRLIERAAVRRDFDCASAHARQRLGLDELHEPAHRWQMRLAAWSGDRGAAMRQYRECVRVLDQELGVAPLAETTALYEEIRDGGELPLPPAPSPAATEIPPHERPASLAPDVLPLVGRDASVRQLLGVWDRCSERAGQLAVVHGQAGVGKTRLVDELLDTARARGARVIAVRCYEGEQGLAYAPFVEALRTVRSWPDVLSTLHECCPQALAEAARLAPDMAPTAVPLLDGNDAPGARVRFSSGIVTVLDVALAGPVPGILAIDDAQWLDSASLELLGYLVRRLDQQHGLTVLTWRDQDVGPGHPLRRMLSEAARIDRSTSIALGLLDERDVETLVVAATGPSGTGATSLARRLFEESGGLPLFLVEYLRELRVAGTTAGDGPLPLPASIRDLLASRLAAIEGVAGQLVTVLAVIGRPGPFELLRDVSGRGDDETVTALDTLVEQGMVREAFDPGGVPVYGFTHDRLRAAAYDTVTLARRRLLHRRVADTLLRRTTGQRRSVAAQAAHHLRLAGSDDAAAEQYRLAGEDAASVFALDEAIDLFRTALALGHSDATRLHLAIGDLQTLRGAYAAALASYEVAAALSTDGALATVDGRLGSLNLRLGRWERAEQHFAAATEGRRGASEDPAATAALYSDWSLVAHRRGAADDARARAQVAFEQAQVAGDQHAISRVHNLLGILARADGDLAGATTELRESLRLAERSADPLARTAALNNLALVASAAGDNDAAIAQARAALQIAVDVGDRHREAALRSNLADFLHASGLHAEARAEITRSATIYGEIGVVAGEPEPGVWKLMEW